MIVLRTAAEPRVVSLDQDATTEGGLTVLDRLACPNSPSLRTKSIGTACARWYAARSPC